MFNKQWKLKFLLSQAYDAAASLATITAYFGALAVFSFEGSLARVVCLVVVMIHTNSLTHNRIELNTYLIQEMCYTHRVRRLCYKIHV